MKRLPRGFSGVVRRVGIGAICGVAVFAVWLLRPWELPGWALLLMPGLLFLAWWYAGKALSPDDLRELRRQLLQIRLARLLRPRPVPVVRGERRRVVPMIDDLEKTYSRLAHLLTFEAAEAQVALNDWLKECDGELYVPSWESPLGKILLPVLLEITQPGKYYVQDRNYYDTARDTYTYVSARYPYLVTQFEPFRAVIEQIWRCPVIIEAVPTLPGAVRIRPRPRLPAVIPLVFGDPGSVILGTDLLTAEVAAIDAADLPHLLLMGTSGFGKSVFLHQLIAQLLRAPDASVERVLLVDLKGGVEFVRYERADARVRAVWQFDQVVQVVHDLVELMQTRQAEMLERGWRVYRGGRVFFIVDEFAQIQLWPVEGKEGRQEHERLLANLNRLSMLGRSAGIVLVAAVQKATTDVMDSSFRTNLQGQVCFRMPNRLAAASMFGSLDDLALDPVALPKGQFIFYDPTVGRTRYLQAHVIQDEASP